MDEPQGVISIVWVSDKLGAAYYDPETFELQLLPDIVEYASQNFVVMNSLLRNVNPKYIIVSARQDARVIAELKSFCSANRGASGGGSAVRADESHERSQLMTLQVKDFAPDPGRERLEKQRLPDESEDMSEEEHLIYIRSKIPFHQNLMVRAAGSLLRFLDKTSQELLHIRLRNGVLPVLNMPLLCLKNMVALDSSFWSNLQIFPDENNPNVTTTRVAPQGPKDLSLFGELNGAVTQAGSKHLKSFLAHPTRDINILNRRLDVIEYCASPANSEFVKTARKYFKGIRSIPKLLMDMQTTNISWIDFHKTLSNIILLIDLVSHHSQRIELFTEIAEPDRKFQLKDLTDEMTRVIDLEETKRCNRFVPNAGLNNDLDSRRRQYKCLPDIMTIVAEEEIRNTPGAVQTCSISFIPEIGFLLAIQKWEEGLTDEQLAIEGLQLMFSCDDVAYYKSDRCKEVDTALGDCIVPIIEMETSLEIELTQFVQKFKDLLLRVHNLIAELDCLIGLAVTAHSHDYVRPNFTTDHRFEIQNGRHPLVELRMQAVPNSTEMQSWEKVVLLSGPNAGGKSVYLKQVVLIAYMALIGSFVPATAAWIPLFDKLFAVVDSRESITCNASTFQRSISQLSLAISNYTKDSLLVIDEFGKGTTETDGLSLLISVVEHLVDLGENCPLVFLSTHFHSVVRHFPPTQMLKTKKMEFHETEESVVFMYKVIDGFSSSSFAFAVAQRYGLTELPLSRAREVYEVVHNHQDESTLYRGNENGGQHADDSPRKALLLARKAMLEIADLADAEVDDPHNARRKSDLIFSLNL